MTRVATIGLVLLCSGSLGLFGCGDGEEGKHPGAGATGGYGGGGAVAETGGQEADTGGRAGTGGSTGGQTGTGGSTGGQTGTGGSTGGQATGGAETSGAAGSAGEAGEAGAVGQGTAGISGAAGSAVQGLAGAAGSEITAGSGPEGGAGLGGDATGAAGLQGGAGQGGDAAGAAGLQGGAGQGTGGSGDPTCVISSPVFTPTHPALNGVPVADGGDRVSSPGSAYQARVEVETSVEEGQPVGLVVDGGAPLYSVASSGVAVFPAVAFEPDGDHSVQADCRAQSGEQTLSDVLTVPVDTTAPDLAVSKETPDGRSALQDADHFVPEDDMDAGRDGLQIRLCGTTTSSDAIDVEPARNNFAVRLLPGESLLGEAPVTSVASNGACVNVDCPGSGAFDVVLSVADAAGNPAAITLNNLTCASNNPLVMLVDPASDAPDFDNPLLAADDTRPLQIGDQYNVVACTNAPVGSAAELYSGLASGSLALIATTTVEADVAGGICEASQLNRAVFTAATLTPSGEDQVTFELTDPTRLQVEVTDSNLGVGSAVADVWVDMRPPVLSLRTTGICGGYITDAGPVTRTLTFGTPLASVEHPVTVAITDEDANTGTYYGTAFNSIALSTTVSVQFQSGVSQLVAWVTEPSGNTGFLPDDCIVTVGLSPPPTVTWVDPVARAALIAAVEAPDTAPEASIEDADPAAPGWQGDLSVSTSLTGADTTGVSVTFTAVPADGSEPTVLGTVDLEENGTATLLDADVPEGMGMRLKAQTSAGTFPSASSTIVVDVDVTPPTDLGHLIAEVAPGGRRQTTFRLAWTAGAGAAGYDVRRGLAAITADTFYEGKRVPFGGQPQPEGSDETLDVPNLYFEKDYYFAVRGVDEVGNRSPALATVDAARAPLLFADLQPPDANVGFGWTFDGSGDVNGDGYSDLLVGTMSGASAYLYLGGADGLSTTPIRLTGEPGSGFGFAAAIVRDIGSDPSTPADDGIDDIVVGAHYGANRDGVVYVFYGRRSWTSPVDFGAADVIVNTDSTATGDVFYATGELGFSLASLGNFDGQGKGDFAIGVPYYRYISTAKNYQGQVVVIRGADRPHGTTLTVPAAFGTDAIRIDGEASVPGILGRAVAGIGARPGSDNTVLVASAPYARIGGTVAAGRVYAITGTSGVDEISIAEAPSLSGSVTSERLGFVLSPVGDLGPGGAAAIGLPLPTVAAPGRAEIRSGTDVDGLFASYLRLRPAETTGSQLFGATMIGGVVPGTGAPASIIGSALSDVIVPTRTTDPQLLYVVDGRDVTLSNSEVDITKLAATQVELPWAAVGFPWQVTVLTHTNDDSWADFAISEASSSSSINGRIRVYW